MHSDGHGAQEWVFQPSSFVSHLHFQCVRKLGLDAAARAHGPQAAAEAAPDTLLGEQHTHRGYAFEAAVCAGLQRLGLLTDFPTPAPAAAPGAPTANPNQALLDMIMAVPTGTVHFIAQAVVTVPDAVQGALRMSLRPQDAQRLRFSRTKPDLLQVEVDAAGTHRWVTVIDIKSSARAKAGHRMQIAFYFMCLEVICADHRDAVTIRDEGVVWLPRGGGPTIAEDGVGDATVRVGGLHTEVPFLVNKRLVVDFFAQTLPQAMAPVCDWAFQPSCRGCPHLATCKVDDAARTMVPAQDQATQEPRIASHAKDAVRRQPSTPLVFVNGPSDPAKLLVLVLAESFRASPTVPALDYAIAARLPSTADERQACQATLGLKSSDLDASDAVWTQRLTSMDALVALLHAHVVVGGGDVAVWDEGQRRALTGLCQEAFTAPPPCPLAAPAGRVLQRLWEDCDALQEPCQEPFHRLSRRCYAVHDVLTGLYALPSPGPVTFEETRLLPLARPARYFPAASAEVFDAFFQLEGAPLPIRACFQDTFAVQSPARQCALATDLLNLMLLAVDRAKGSVRPFPPTTVSAVSAGLGSEPVSFATVAATAASDAEAVLALVRRQTLYSACRKATDVWLEGNAPIQLVYDPPAPVVAPGGTTPDYAQDPRPFLCRLRVLAPDAALARISPCGLPVFAAQEGTPTAMPCPKRQQPRGPKCGAPMAPVLCTAAEAALSKGACAPGMYGFRCAAAGCGHVAALDGLLDALEAGLLADFQLTESPAPPDTVDSSKPYLVKNRCNVLLVEQGAADATGTEAVPPFYLYIARGNLAAPGSGFVPPSSTVLYLHRRVVDFTTQPLRQYVFEHPGPDPLAALPALRLVTGKLGAAAPPTHRPEVNAAAVAAATSPHHPLSGEQVAAIAHSLGPSPLTILWGPPGTGKTSTLQTMLCAWLRAVPTLRVLVVAFTKAALEVVVQGPRGIAQRGCPHLWIQGQFSGLNAAAKAQCLAQDGLVVLSTVWQAAKMLNGKNYPAKVAALAPFDALVIDEASQMTIAQALLASRLLKPNGKVVVAGDLLQLPPIQEDVTAFLDAALGPGTAVAAARRDLLFACRQSIMQAVMVSTTGARMLHCSSEAATGDGPKVAWQHVVQLRQSYRSLPAIVAFVGASYPDGMQATRKVPLPAAFLAPTDPTLLTLQLRGAATVESEAEFIVQTVLAGIFARQAEAAPAAPLPSVIVVCPHRRQRYSIAARVAKHLRPAWAAQVTTETTEKTQGSEADIVLVAFAGGVDYAAPFPFEFTRLNVAISRAKDRVVLVVGAAFPLAVAAEEHFEHVGSALGAIRGMKLLQRFVKESELRHVVL